MFTIRAVTLDHYMSKSISELYSENNANFHQSSLEPVIRIFGSTPEGKKSCVHIHGVFPYIYVPYRGGDNPQRDALILGAALDEALKSSTNQQNYRFIFKVSIVAGIPLYGYHGSARQFFKIFFYNPYYIRKASDLLLAGAILGQKLQPHEAHIPFTLQFMIDYDVYGMSFVSFSKIKYRKNFERPESLNALNRDVILPDKIKKMTCSYFEADALVTDIIQKDKTEMTTSNPGLRAIWEDEKIRRRNQGKLSQIAIERSQSRKHVKISATEAMYKGILAQKLENIFRSDDDPVVDLNESQFSYPATLPENTNLENSMVCEGEKYQPQDIEDDLDHIRSLIDVQILNETIADTSEIGEEVEEAEADSVLGKDLKKGVEEEGDGEEVELEGDDSGDMTQSLEAQLDNSVSSSNGNQSQEASSSANEEEFWRKMAGKLFQFDGAQDTSSDTDTETTDEIGIGSSLQAKHVSRDVPSFAQESLNNTLSSSLSENDLNQSDSVSLIDLPLDCSSYSPKIDCSWLPANDEPWNWDKTDIFADYFPSKNQTVGVGDLAVANAIRSCEALTAKDLLENCFFSSQTDIFPENYTALPPASSAGGNLKSICESSPSSTSTLPNENTNFSYRGLNSSYDISDDVCKLPSAGRNESDSFTGPRKSETKTIPKQSLKVTLAKDLKNLKQKISSEDSPREASSLTLKEYLKDFGEIVNVDFKNFNDQEMVIVEYKPFPGKSNQNKFLIKPLNKFLENWNTAEKEINTTALSNKRGTTRFRKGRSSASAAAAGEYFEEHKTDRRFSSSTSFASSSSTNRKKTNIKSTKNEYVLKATKISPENPEFVKFNSRNDGEREEDAVSQKTSKRYSKKFLFKNLKQNLIKVGEISRNFSNFSNAGKDQNGNHISSCGLENFKNKVDSDEDSTSDVDMLGDLKFCNRKNKSKKSSVNSLYENRKFVKKKRGNISSGNWKENLEEKNMAELDIKLVEEINSCFENYFKNIIKINNCFNEKCRNLFLSRKNKSDDDSEMSSNEEDYSGASNNGAKKEFIALCQENPNVQKLLGSNSKSIKFIAQFLSAFSEMSRFAETPPLAITIKVGDRRNLMSAPVHLNLKSRSRIADGNETEAKSKKPRRKLKIESVDGPADSPSTDDSEGKDDLKNQLYFRKKIKGGKYYKSLNVVLCKSSGSEKIVEKRKRKSSECSSTFDDVFNSDNCSDRKRSRKKDSLDVYSKSQRESTKQIKEHSGSEKRSSRSDLTKFKSHSKSVEVAAEEGKKSEITAAHSSEQRKSIETDPKPSTFSTVDEQNMRIPQVDVNASSSSDEEEFFRRTCAKKSTKKMKRRKRKIVVEKISPDTRTPENLDAQEAINVGQDEDCPNSDNLENTLVENLDDILNKTCFKIPAKWSDAEESENDSENVTLTECSRNLSSPSASCPENLGSYQKNLSSPWSENSRCTADDDDMCKSQSGSSFPFERSTPSTNYNSTKESEKDLPIDKALKEIPKEKREKDLKVKSCRDRKIVDGISASSLTTIVSKVKPPSRKTVLDFLSKHENLKSCSDVPHYSNPRDVRKPLEIGPVTLKVETNSLPGLKPYKSDLVEQETEDRRNHFLSSQDQKFENVRPFLVANKRFTITPLKNPPFSSFVINCLKSDNKSAGAKNEEKTSKKKIFVPLSPGQDSQSDDEVDLSVTIGSLSESSRKFESDTPSSRESSQNIKYMLEGIQNESVANVENLDKCKGAKKEKCAKCGNLEVIAEELESSNCSKIATPIDKSDSSEDSKISKDSLGEVKTYGEQEHSRVGIKNSNSSFGIRGVTLDDTFGFSHSVENFQKIKLNHLHQHITLLIIELHVETRKDLRPDPKFDCIKALFYTITFDSPTRDQETGVVVVGDRMRLLDSHVVVHRVQSETELIYQLVSLMKDWDPDILAGYEIEMNSWGYLVQRGFHLEINLLSLLARVQTESSQVSDKYKDENDELELHDIPKYVRNLRIVGRIVLDIWRLLRHEMALTSYTFENVMYHVTQERHPLISFKALTDYWNEPSGKYICITAQYYISRVKGEIKILEQLDFINRTSELARLFGIQFIEVLSRGSQFRVESMMLRLAKSQNYIPVSPSIKQRAEMRAPASLPLILEPESLFYTDPVIVLDFQSLYPSMIIAYNYCFSTCLGRLEKLGSNEPFDFGCTQLQISAKELKDMENDIHISPAGVAFVSSNIRKGVLPSMLEEILETRLMVKKSMKENKNEKLLLKVLHARQLGLKLIANVTYGYTAANFSGRMPCIEVGDSVVSKGRETLHRAIELIKSNPRWGARVVYGDTDSIFVLTPRKTREEAFEIGAEIAEAVTQDNPKPVKLKLEKVYQPCILQTKKRYVGYMFESPDQKEPILEAKGIETVRRDGCPAVKKILQKALQILFDTKDVSLVKKYTIRQFVKLFENRVNVQDLIFAKEYRGRAGYRPGACVPALELARQRTRYDKRAEPRVKERVPYVIVNGLPGVPLIKLVRSPSDLLEDPSLRINAVYYITKAIIPPMHRCFSLLGVDVPSWYLEMPKKEFRRFNSTVFADHKKRTISQYFSNVECILCPNMTTNPVCNECKERPQVLTVGLTEKIRIWERRHHRIMKICQSCHGHFAEPLCQSFDCPVLFRRIESSRNLEQIPTLLDVLTEQTVIQLTD